MALRTRNKDQADVVASSPPSTTVAQAAARRPGGLRGAGLAVLGGQLLLLVSSSLHPSGEHPADHTAVFGEYAADASWTTVHLVQWVGGMAMFLGLALLAQHVIRGGGRGTVTARVALAATGVVATVFTVLQAVDGVALKMAVDAWEGIHGGDAAPSFSAAEAIRWIEIGLNALARILQGIVIGLVAIAATAARINGRPLAAVGLAAGIGGVAGGVATAYTGFSTLVAVIAMGPWFLQMLWVIAIGVRMFGRAKDGAR